MPDFSLPSLLSDLLPAPPALALFLLLISPAVGSFLALLADRLPRGESAVTLRSHCRSCAHPLRAWDLLPVLSFTLNRGCCRYCGAAIAPWHLYTELAALGLAALALGLGGSAPEIALTALALWLLWVLALCDLLWFRLPDILTATLALLALAWAGAVQISLIPAPPHPLLPQTIGQALTGGGIGVASLWLLRLGYQYLRNRAGLGLGDVKLMAGLGGLTGAWLLPHLLLLAALLALAGAVISARCQRRALKASRALPFGAALCASAALIWLLARLPY